MSDLLEMYGIRNVNPFILLTLENIDIFGDDDSCNFRITNYNGSETYYYDKGNLKIELKKYLSHNDKRYYFQLGYSIQSNK